MPAPELTRQIRNEIVHATGRTITELGPPEVINLSADGSIVMLRCVARLDPCIESTGEFIDKNVS